MWYSGSSGDTEYNNGYEYDSINDIISWTPADSATTIKFKGTTVSGWSTNSTNNTPASAAKTDDLDAGHESLGNYYDWTAAIASNDSSSLTSNTRGNISNNPQNSICPKGWRLPTISNQSEMVAGSTNEFARLNYLYNNGSTTSSFNLSIEPLWFVMAGYVDSSSLLSKNSRGLYWSSTVIGSVSAPNLDFSINGINPGSVALDRRLRGFSVRCLARTED